MPYVLYASGGNSEWSNLRMKLQKLNYGSPLCYLLSITAAIHKPMHFPGKKTVWVVWHFILSTNFANAA